MKKPTNARKRKTGQIPITDKAGGVDSFRQLQFNFRNTFMYSDPSEAWPSDKKKGS